MRAPGIATLADFTVRIPRWRQWWKAVPRRGPASARRVEVCLAAHLALTGWVRVLVAVAQRSGIMPWTQPRLPRDVDGSAGTFSQPSVRSTRTTLTKRCTHGCRCTDRLRLAWVRPCFRDLRSLEASTAKYPRRLRS
uniref:phage integrase family protein n=1 Tax=Burkholderia cepacia TaxID=292 RepID=UPI0021F4EA82